MTQSDWWRKHAGEIVAMGAPGAAIQPTQVYSKEGVWPLIKLVGVRISLDMYSTILNSEKQKGRYDSVAFVDLCAGSGLTELRSQQRPGATKIMAGTALIGASNPKFDHYYYVEPGARRAGLLGQRLGRYQTGARSTVYPATAGAALPQVLQSLASKFKKPHFVVVADPEGFTEVTLPELEPLLRSGRGDLLLNFQDRMVPRLLVDHEDVLQRFFGEEDVKAGVEEFGPRDYLLRRLAYYGRPKAEVVRVEAGGQGAYGYDVVWAAPETRGGNPWLASFREIVENRIRGVDGQLLDSILFGGQQSLV